MSPAELAREAAELLQQYLALMAAGQFTRAADAAERLGELAKKAEDEAWDAHVARCDEAGVSPFDRVGASCVQLDSQAWS